MSDYDPNTMTVYAGDCMYVVCWSCGDPVLDDDHEPSRMTVAELDTACQRHWREAHEHTDVTPM